MEDGAGPSEAVEACREERFHRGTSMPKGPVVGLSGQVGGTARRPVWPEQTEVGRREICEVKGRPDVCGFESHRGPLCWGHRKC